MKSNFLQFIRQNQILTAIFLGSFFICIFYFFYHRIHPVVDAQAYDQIGWNLAQGLGFREDATKSYEFDHAITRAGPGYEFFLAGIYVVFGHHYEPVWIMQAILHVLSAYLLYLVSRRIFPEWKKAALISTALFAFWPDLIEISAMLMTETLYLFFTILVIYLFVRAYEAPQHRTLAALLGAATGIAILTRPPILLFIPIFFFFYFSATRMKNNPPSIAAGQVPNGLLKDRGGLMDIYIAMSVFSLFLILTLAPWTIRNYFVYHQPILTTMIGQYNLWLGNTLASDGGQYNLPYNPLNEFVDQEGFFGLKDKARAEFLGFVLAHPFIFLKLCALRFIRYFSLIRPMGFWFYQSGLPQLAFIASSLFWIVGVFIAGFSGMVMALKKEYTKFTTHYSLLTTIHSYLAVLALTAPMLLLPTVVQSRYRFQIYPFLALFAGYAIAKRKLEIIPILLLAVVTAIDIVLNLGLIADRLFIRFNS